MNYFFELFFLLASVFLTSESGFPKLLSKVTSEKSMEILSVDFFEHSSIQIDIQATDLDGIDEIILFNSLSKKLFSKLI